MHAAIVRAVSLSLVLSWAQTFAATVYPPKAEAKPPTVVRFETNPIIRPEMLPGKDGANICGPSLIKAPAWLTNPLGKYYLYFADHKGSYIRLAYADRVEGPWKIHGPGTLQLDQVVAVARAAAGEKAAEVKGNHIASPDVHVDDERKEIRMYFHFQIAPAFTWGHRSGVAVSKDGIRFEPVGTKPIGEPYFRVFRWEGYYYAINRSAALARSRDGLTDFEVGNTAFAEAIGHKTLARVPAAAAEARNKRDAEDAGDGIRHTAIKIDGNVMTVFYSRAGDLPEMLLSSTVVLSGDWKQWRLSPPTPVLAPTMDYEGANVPSRSPTNAEMRVLPRPMFRELRDPCIYREQGTTYLLYAVAGERGIAGSILRD
jgi:hypothetical protein